MTDNALEEQRARAFGAGVVYDPYAEFAELRGDCPVQRGSITANFPAMNTITNTMAPTGDQAYSVYSFREGCAVLRTPELFRSGPQYAMLTAAIGDTIISMDGPEHRRMRMLMQPSFSRRQMEDWSERIIRPIVDEHLDRIVGLGKADLYREIGSTVPVHTIASAIGLPGADRERFFDWAVAMTATTSDPMERFEASQAVATYLEPFIAKRRRNPQNDLLSKLVVATLPADADENVEDRPLTDEEINAFVRVFIIAGAGTTYRGYGITMLQLLRHPAVLAEVRADRSLVRNAIDEALRIDQPLALLGRGVAENTIIGGVELAEGSMIEVSVSAANHDPAEFAEPEMFDLHREGAQHSLTFGYGQHRCIGVHLAMAELTVMIDRTLDRLEDLRLDPDAPVPEMTGLVFRMPTAVPVLFTPA